MSGYLLVGGPEHGRTCEIDDLASTFHVVCLPDPMTFGALTGRTDERERHEYCRREFVATDSVTGNRWYRAVFAHSSLRDLGAVYRELANVLADAWIKGGTSYAQIEPPSHAG